jgi:hypothetical protein
MKELLTTRRYGKMDDDLINDMTREMDEHLLDNYKEYNNYCGGTYLWHTRSDKNHFAIRYPGATRGHIELDENDVIRDIKLYDTAHEHPTRCYKLTVVPILLKYVGMKLVIVGGE